MTSDTARREVVRVCRRLYARGLIAGTDGNVSVRLETGRILVTPAGAAKADCGPDDLVELTLGGELVASGGASSRRASSEVAMHLRIYRRRSDVAAIVHAHPPAATAFAVAGEAVPAGVLPELDLLVGRVPLVPFAAPGTEALADALEPYLDGHDAFLLANHGATTVGPTLTTAHHRMESLEHAARIVLAARLLGCVTPLSADQLRTLAGGARRAGSAT